MKSTCTVQETANFPNIISIKTCWVTVRCAQAMLQKLLFNMLVKQIKPKNWRKKKHTETIQRCKITNSPKIWTVSGDWMMVAMDSTMRGTLGQGRKRDTCTICMFISVRPRPCNNETNNLHLFSFSLFVT